MLKLKRQLPIAKQRGFQSSSIPHFADRQRQPNLNNGWKHIESIGISLRFRNVKLSKVKSGFTLNSVGFVF